MATPPSYKAGVFALSAICGLIDVACFLALGGVFAELMTGNLLLFAITLGLGDWDRMPIYVAAIAPFCLGAFSAGLFTNGKHALAGRIIGYPVEFGCVVLATVVALILHPSASGPEDAELSAPVDYREAWQRMLIVAILAFAMGIHNTLMRKHGVADIATNVLTLTLTGFVSESKLAGGPGTHWQRRIGSIAIFVVFAAIGAFLLKDGVARPLILASIIFAIALWPLMKGRSDFKAPVPDPAPAKR